MRANDPILAVILHPSEQRSSVREQIAQDPEYVQELWQRVAGGSGGAQSTEKDPYVILARAVLMQAMRDSQRTITKSNKAEVEAAIRFLDMSVPNADRDFWRDAARLG